MTDWNRVQRGPRMAKLSESRVAELEAMGERVKQAIRSPEHEQLLRSLERDEANLAAVKQGIERAESLLSHVDELLYSLEDCPRCGHLMAIHDPDEGCRGSLARYLELGVPACGCRMPRETNGPQGETISGKRETGGKPCLPTRS